MLGLDSTVQWSKQAPGHAQLIATPCLTAAAEQGQGTASHSGLNNSLLCRREWCNTARRLQNQQHAAEGAISLPDPSLRDVRQAQLAASEQEAQRRLLAAALAAKTARIERIVDSVTEKMQNPQPGAHFVRAIAEALDACETGITDLKEEQHQQLDDLAREEQHMSRDLELLLERMESPAWDLAPQQDSYKAQHLPANKGHTAHQSDGGLLPAVEAFDDFHAQHGPTGGWHPDDHAEFERILKACKGDYSHATLMCYDEMIGFKRADIIAHARWHAEHQELYVRKRIAVAEWRSQKDAQKAALAAEAYLEPATAREAQEQRRQQQQQDYSHMQQTRQSLVYWKADKKREKQQAAAEQQKLQEQAKQAERAALAERQLTNKQQLQAYQTAKMQQEAEAAREAASENSKAAARLSPGQLQRLKERNEQLMQRKLEAASQKHQQEEERIVRIEMLQEQVSAKVNAKVQKDPQRVLKKIALRQRWQPNKEWRLSRRTATVQGRVGSSGIYPAKRFRPGDSL